MAGLRVVYLIDSLAPGGAERSLAALAPALISQGLDLEVVSLHDRPGVEEELREAGARLRSVAGPGGRLGWIRRATDLIRARRPDLVHTTLFEADVAGRIAARRARTPVVSSLVNDAYGRGHQGMPGVPTWRIRAAQLVDAGTARLVTRFHAISNSVLDAMIRRLWISRSRGEVIPRGRDPSVLGTRTAARRREVRRRLGIGDDATVVLAAARQEYQKGLDVLLRAFPGVRDRGPGRELVVAGREGSLTPRLEGLVREEGMGEDVRFLGGRDDVPDLLAAADVFVLPSRWEGAAGVLIEAMALETPVIATDLPSVRETVGTVARLVPPGRPALLAEAIVDVLADDEARRRMAADGRRRFLERFTVDRIATQMLGFYARAMGREA